MTDASPLARLVPGFEFLQSLAKTAGSAIPGLGGPGGIGQWVAPTLDPAEIGKRIDELRTVQFWLEQNARMLATTIQALEVQKMTLATLKTMNVPLGDFRKATAGTAPAVATSAATTAKPAAGVVDPMQWWTALTGQFAQLAAGALKDGAADAAKAMAGTMPKATTGAAVVTAKAAAGKTASRRKRPAAA